MNPVELNLFESRLSSVCDEMGLVLRNAAFSPNIRDRLDYSCAIFDAQGELCAQAAHIPVHLGSMAYAMGDLVSRFDWAEGDQVILNDPYLGGTHLPDVTMIAPVFHRDLLTGFVVNRAHHADIGASAPGSMPISSSLEEEGLLISPVHLVVAGQRDQALWQTMLSSTRSPLDSAGDFEAQLAANSAGQERLKQLVQQMGEEAYQVGLRALNAYAERLADAVFLSIPNGQYSFEDILDDDGQGQSSIPIRIKLVVEDSEVIADFEGTADQVAGNVNCPVSVVASAVYYVFRCLMPAQTPACAGAFRKIHIRVPEASLLNARYPAAVAAGNVETSTRIVDVVMGALVKALPDQLPAASHGSMNNVAMGASGASGATETAGAAGWDYYETIGGGMGAGPMVDGSSGLQTHMTNTRNTPIEVLESRYPLRLREYALRADSGGTGEHSGGDGLIREFEVLQQTQVSLLTERRVSRPWGLGAAEIDQHDQQGQAGRNLLNGREVPAKCFLQLQVGDRLRIETPGGGGWSASR